MKTTNLLANILLCSLCLLGLPQLAAAGGVNVLDGLTRSASLNSGEKSEGKITLQNTQEVAQEVKVFATDYQRNANGESSYGEAGSTPRSNSNWITFTPHQVIIPAKSTFIVYYTIQVPTDPLLVGTYWSVLMVEPVSKASLEPPKVEKDKIKLGITTISRYAIQMITDIGATGKRAIKFSKKDLLVQDKSRTYQVDIENTGERSLTPTLWIELYDTEGVSQGRIDGNRWRIYPGGSARFNIDLTKIPVGVYTGLLVADNGDEYIFGTQVKLDIKAIEEPQIKVIDKPAEVTGNVVP